MNPWSLVHEALAESAPFRGRQDGQGRGAERMEKWYTDREEGRGGGCMAGRQDGEGRGTERMEEKRYRDREEGRGGGEDRRDRGGGWREGPGGPALGGRTEAPWVNVGVLT